MHFVCKYLLNLLYTVKTLYMYTYDSNRGDSLYIMLGNVKPLCFSGSLPLYSILTVFPGWYEYFPTHD